ncbi:MAG: GHKL domain-containing protein [Saprospiraceae bacterium]|nr:GHKL domain-containing protein [Saprospiraceae bacterium]
MKGYVYLIVLMLAGMIFLPLLGQQVSGKIDQLEAKLPQVEGMEKVNVLMQLASESRISSAKNAKEYGQEARKLSEKIDFSLGVMNSNYLLGELEKEERHYKRAANRLEESVAAARKMKDVDGLLRSLILLKKVYILDKRQRRWVETEKEIQDIQQRVNLDEKTELLADLEQDYDKKVRELSVTRGQRSRLAREKAEVEDELAETTEEKLRQEAELALLAQEKAELELATSQLEKEAAMAALDVVEKENALLQSKAKLKRQQFWQVVLGLGLLSSLAIIFLLMRYQRLKKQNAEERLQTQRQLLMQEKMATLGQLTAGIAHEIKNPLNFVNNFAEGSLELSEELVETLAQEKDNIDNENYDLSLEIVQDLKTNASDILENGKRADRIVHSMMEHARGGDGQPQVTEVNTLVEDNLNLAYHGYRANSPSFQLEMVTDLDENLPSITLVPQDLSRVLLNIINNACYALNEKQQEKIEGYRSKLTIKTAKEGEELVIRVTDNGPGIPEDIRSKIFNHFFTTKPTGDGNAGLGLSICYEIVVQNLGGKLEVESEEGVFTTFIIRLPYSTSKKVLGSAA